MELSDPVGVGELVASKYRVEERLGSGSMGVVYAARHEELDERVALKFLSPLLAADESARVRFQREAKHAFTLKSEHVARVFDVGRLESGAPFIVMEFLDGLTLKRHVDLHGALSHEETLAVMLQICEGVAEAHSRGIVHRDLKPENIFLTKLASGSPLVKVLDFGISKISALKNVGITSADQVIGTPRYMSPEQFRKSADVTAESDVWALGVIAYWLLSKAFPFAGETAQVALVNMFSGADPIPLGDVVRDLDPDLEKIVMKCLTRDKSGRFANADVLRRALAPFYRGSIVTAGAARREDPIPETHRSMVSPKDAPTLTGPRSSLVTDAKVPAPTERDKSDAAAKIDSTLLPTTKRLDVNTKRMDEKDIDANAMEGEKAKSSSDTKIGTVRLPPMRSPDKSATLPLGMVYDVSGPLLRPPSDHAEVKPLVTPSDVAEIKIVAKQESTPGPAPSSPVPAALSEPGPDSRLETTVRVPMQSASRARIFIVLAVFIFVAGVVWMLTTKQ